MHYLSFPRSNIQQEKGEGGGVYWGLGVILLQYFPLVKIWNLLHYNCIHINSKNKKHLKGSTLVTILPLAIGLYDGLGDYCCPHTAFSVFLTSLLHLSALSYCFKISVLSSILKQPGPICRESATVTFCTLFPDSPWSRHHGRPARPARNGVRSGTWQGQAGNGTRNLSWLRVPAQHSDHQLGCWGQF